MDVSFQLILLELLLSQGMIFTYFTLCIICMLRFLSKRYINSSYYYYTKIINFKMVIWNHPTSSKETFYSNSEANASELVENPEEMFI